MLCEACGVPREHDLIPFCAECRAAALSPEAFADRRRRLRPWDHCDEETMRAAALRCPQFAWVSHAKRKPLVAPPPRVAAPPPMPARDSWRLGGSVSRWWYSDHCGGPPVDVGDVLAAVKDHLKTVEAGW